MHGLDFVLSMKCDLWHMRWRNANIETEKSEQTLFAQIFLSQYYYLFNVCTVKRFKDCNTKLDHANLLS